MQHLRLSRCASVLLQQRLALQPTMVDCNDWSRAAPALPRFKEALRVAIPCCGIDGAGHALQAMNVNFQCCMVYDLEQGYLDHLQNLMPDSTIHVGKKRGDVTAVPLDKLERPIHAVVTGPPCPPWSAAGKRQSQLDSRADAMIYVLRMIVALAAVGELQFAIVENVPGICMKEKGQDQSFLDKIMRLLAAHCPNFVWSYCKLSALDFNLAQARSRVFIRGMRTSLGSAVPPPLPPFGHKKLQDFILEGLPPVQDAQLTAHMKRNLQCAERDLRTMLADGRVQKDSLVIMPLDRSDEGVYKRQYQVDRCCTLTCNNTYLFIASMDLHKEKSDRRCWRFLRDDERMVLQGFPSKTLEGCASNLRRQAAGNAYPVPLLLATAHPLLALLGKKQHLLKKGGKMDDAKDVVRKFDLAVLKLRRDLEASRAKKAGKAPWKKPAAKVAVKKRPSSASGVKRKTRSRPSAVYTYLSDSDTTS